jgi:hypothetical protein
MPHGFLVALLALLTPWMPVVDQAAPAAPVPEPIATEVGLTPVPAIPQRRDESLAERPKFWRMDLSGDQRRVAPFVAAGPRRFEDVDEIENNGGLFRVQTPIGFDIRALGIPLEFAFQIAPVIDPFHGAETVIEGGFGLHWRF